MTGESRERVSWCVQGLQGGQPGPQSGSEECRVGGQEENIRQHGENSASHLLQVCRRDKVTNTHIINTINTTNFTNNTYPYLHSIFCSDLPRVLAAFTSVRSSDDPLHLPILPDVSN